MAADAINNILHGKGNIAIVGYKEKLDSQEQRIQGFKDKISKYKGIKIVDTTCTEDYLKETRDKFI